MSGIKRVLIGGTGALLLAFVGNGIYTWVRAIEMISVNGASTLIKISQRNASVRPFFIAVFIICAVTFELSRRQLPAGWRFAYLITLGLGAALLLAPWLVDLVFS